ncbi:MAG TPA: F0F1 ATP synthase subunit delta [Candidatus Saccharimonadales bacterium]
MRAVSRRLLARSFASELLKAPLKKQHLIQSLAAYLLETKQIKTLDMVLADITKELANRGHVAAEVITAREISSVARAAITELVKSTTGATTAELSESTSPDLIGGVKLTIPGRELDTSVKRQLQQLKAER